MAKSSPTEVPHLLQANDPRSHRYEVDENPAFSPPSSTHMFQIFDSSEVFNKHPRKFDLLKAQDDSAVKGGATEIVKASKSRSRSMAVLGSQSSEDYKKLLSEHQNHPAMGPPSGNKLEVPKTDTTGPRRRTSVAVMERSMSQPVQGAGSVGTQSASKTSKLVNIVKTLLSYTVMQMVFIRKLVYRI